LARNGAPIFGPKRGPREDEQLDEEVVAQAEAEEEQGVGVAYSRQGTRPNHSRKRSPN